MTATAVVVLTAVARDEFERAWHGFEEPFAFINGDDETIPSVSEFTATVEGETYSLPARAVAELVIGQLADFREEVDDEDGDESFRTWSITHWPTDEDKDEEALRRLWAHWSDALETPAEFLAVLDARVHYLAEGLKEMVANFNMIGDRIPALRPRLAEALQEAADALTRILS